MKLSWQHSEACANAPGHSLTHAPAHSRINFTQSHLQQLALAQPRVANHQHVYVTARGHAVRRAGHLAHAAKQRQQQPRFDQLMAYRWGQSKNLPFWWWWRRDFCYVVFELFLEGGCYLTAFQKAGQGGSCSGMLAGVPGGLQMLARAAVQLAGGASMLRGRMR